MSRRHVGNAMTPAAVRRLSISNRNAATRSGEVLRPRSSMWSSACRRLLAVMLRRSRATLASCSATCARLTRFTKAHGCLDTQLRGKAVSAAVFKAHLSQIFWASRVRQLRKRDGRFDICAALRVENPVLVAHGHSTAKWNRFKKSFRTNVLQKALNHVCVLFVQHLSENALQQAARSCSFVACARSFGILVMRRRGASRSRPVF
jgi:hypothetical protein